MIRIIEIVMNNEACLQIVRGKEESLKTQTVIKIMASGTIIIDSPNVVAGKIGILSRDFNCRQHELRPSGKSVDNRSQDNVAQANGSQEIDIVEIETL